MTYHDWIRLAVMCVTGVGGIAIMLIVARWHKEKTFDVREYLTALGKDRKQHLSRPALAELVALYATTSGYLGALAVKPELFPEATAVYGSIWAVRGGFSTYLRSKSK